MIVIGSDYNRDELAAKLKSHLGPVLAAFGGGYRGDKKYIGSCGDRCFNVRIKTSYMNSFAPLFYGRIGELHGRAFIKGFFGFHFAVLIFLAFIYLLAIFILLTKPSAYLGSVILVLMPLPVVFIGKFLARTHKKDIFDYLNIMCRKKP